MKLSLVIVVVIISAEAAHEDAYCIYYCYLSQRIRKPIISMCENKDADQLCFRYTDSTIPFRLNPNSQVSSLNL